jgi:hypothetical protein
VKTDWVLGKLPPRPPAPMTARMLLDEATQGEHALCSVESWGRSGTGSLWIRCSCHRVVCWVLPTPENLLALQNVPEDLEL